MVADEMSDVRTCPVSNEVSFAPVSESLLCLRDTLKPKSEDHKVMGSKTRVGLYTFSSTFQSLGSSARNLRRLSWGAM